MNKEKIRALFPNKEIINCSAYYTSTPPWKMSVDCGNHGVFQSEAGDLFETFINIRKQLRSKGGSLLCNGSRRNIYPSPMLRQSGGGKMAYLLRFGVPARKEDIVDIFDPIEINEIDTLEKQEEFYKQWLFSLEPTLKEIEEARNHPDGWVYRIDGSFSDNEHIPPAAIIGAWEVNSNGEITDKFEINTKYEPSQVARHT